MSKDCGKFLFAHIYIRPVIFSVVLRTERWEFSYGIEEAVVSVHLVSVWEQVFPLCLGKDGLDADYISFSLIVRDVSIKWLWCSNSSLNIFIIRVDYAVMDTEFL